ncbi:GGDEF domain-containing protein [Pseudoduganella violaceinigra]|uniref:GGDEF domain-containing protein n=1 Tax=Pseudoduganella violaceinigra TaxID=246602 RepID=UPI0004116F4A|nr:GGDEF domain-containing protein [Pseudoduganella violaceinigra]
MKSAAESLPLLQGVLDCIDMGALVLDANERVVLWNRWMSQHAGVCDAETRQRNFFDLFPEQRGKRLEAAIGQALRSNLPSLLSQTLNRWPLPLYSNKATAEKGERMQQQITVTPLHLADDERYCLIQVNDVSAAVQRENLLREQAVALRSQTLLDDLTGVANRRHFDMAIDRETRRARRMGTSLSLMMLDIDYFKAYNDHYGHQQGDACLEAVASALSTMQQRPGDLFARYGGEEFAVILPDTPGDAAVMMANAMCRKVRDLRIPHQAARMDEHIVTISIGVACSDSGQADEAYELINAADRALYQAKACGRNRVHSI